MNVMELCKLSVSAPVRPKQIWLPVTLKFMGRDGYILGTAEATASLSNRDGGFGLVFQNDVVVKADQFLGKRIRRGLLTDVKVCFKDLPELSMAALVPGMYPVVLRTDETIRVS